VHAGPACHWHDTLITAPSSRRRRDTQIRVTAQARGGGLTGRSVPALRAIGMTCVPVCACACLPVCACACVPVCARAPPRRGGLAVGGLPVRDGPACHWHDALIKVPSSRRRRDIQVTALTYHVPPIQSGSPAVAGRANTRSRYWCIGQCIGPCISCIGRAAVY
jgi:hypothetical protein